MTFARRGRAALVLAPFLLTSACGASTDDATGSDAAGTERLQVVSTVAPITSIVANIAGDKASISGVVPEGTNSHTFELAEKNAPEDATIVKLGDEVLRESDYVYDFSFPKEDGKPNPHLWTDPTYAIKYADVIKDTLVERDRENAAYYEQNHEKFVAKATALSDAFKADQATIPAGMKQLLSYHDAYAYFAKTYDWQVIGAVQPSNFEDLQPKEIARIIDQVRERRLPVIFGSEVFSSKVLEQIAKETGARYGDTLRDDDLPGEPGGAEHSCWGSCATTT